MAKTFEEVCQELQEVSYTRTAETLPEIFGIENKEVYITQWLARILDPRNGFGYEPLHCLLHCAEGYENVELEEDDNLKIYTEYVFPDSRRRIDILIESDKYIIGIENKIDSGEQKDQTKDYYKSITNMCKRKGKANYYCIYLKPEYNQSEHSSGEFKEVTYTDFKKALEAKRLEVIDPGENNRNIWLMDEFKKYIDEVLTMKNKTFSTKAKLYIKHREKIDNAKNEYEDFLAYVAKRLKDAIEDIDWIRCVVLKDHNTLMQIYSIANDNARFSFHYEIQLNDEYIMNNQLLFSVHLEKYNKEDLESFKQEAENQKLSSEWKLYNKTTCVIEEKMFDICNDNGEIADDHINKIIAQLNEWSGWTKVAENVVSQPS